MLFRSVVQVDTEFPIVSWTHNGTSIAGYNIYLGANASTGQLLNGSLYIGNDFTDNGYAGDSRQYVITAVDTNTIESVGRSVVLPKLKATLAAGVTLQRGIMNKVDYSVSNQGTEPVSGISLQVKAGKYDHATLPFSLAAGETKTVPVIIGGHPDLLDTSPLVTTINVTTNTGEQAQIVRNGEITVSSAAYVLGLQTQNMTRGTTGQVRLTWENTSAVQTDIITALNSGNSNSNEIRFKLIDVDGNVIAAIPFKQVLGNGVITLASTQTVARVDAGATFVSQWLDLPIPSSAPDQVAVKLEIDRFHYHLGAADVVSIAGSNSQRDVSLVDTAYYGAIDSVAPAASFGDVPIVINGKAIDRVSSLPLASVPLKLVFTVRGFEKVKEVFTDSSGVFQYDYVPVTGESGIFTVSAIHPSTLDRPNHGHFTINSVIVQPPLLKLNLGTNINEVIESIIASTGEGTTATNVRLSYSAADQPSGVFPAGITVSPGQPITMAPNTQIGRAHV